MDYEQLLAEGVARKQAETQAEEAAERQFTADQFSRVTEALMQASRLMASFLQNTELMAQVTNLPETARPKDVAEVVKAVRHLETALKPASYDNAEVVAELRAIKEAVRTPKEAPEGPETVTVANWADLSSQFDRVVTAFKALPTPQVDVAAPVVNVEKPDLSGIKALGPKLDAIQAALDALPEKFPKTHVDVDPLITYLPVDIDDATDVQYYGYVSSNGAWYIRRFDQSASPKTIRFHFSQPGDPYDFSSRADYSYTVWGQ